MWGVPHAPHHGPMLQGGGGGKMAHAWPQMGAHRPIVASQGGWGLPLPCCGVGGTTQQPGLGSVAAARQGGGLKCGPPKIACARPQMRAHKQFLACLGAWGLRAACWGGRGTTQQPGLGSTAAARWETNLRRGPPKRPVHGPKWVPGASFGRARAAWGFWLPVGDFRIPHTWPGWAAKPWSRTKGYLGAARGIL